MDTMNNIRLDIFPEVPSLATLLQAKLLAYTKDKCEYYFQEEVGTQTGKLHLQGWIKHSKAVDTFRTHMNTWANGLHDKYKGSETKAFPKTKNEFTQYGYILQDVKKTTKVWTNLTSEDLEIINKNKIKWTEKSQFLEAKGKKVNWHQETLNLLEEYCVTKNLKGEKIINYSLIENVVKPRMPKSLDTLIYQRNLTGLTFHLELKHKNKHNQRAQHMLSESIRNNPQLHDIFNTPI